MAIMKDQRPFQGGSSHFTTKWWRRQRHAYSIVHDKPSLLEWKGMSATYKTWKNEARHSTHPSYGTLSFSSCVWLSWTPHSKTRKFDGSKRGKNTQQGTVGTRAAMRQTNHSVGSSAQSECKPKSAGSFISLLPPHPPPTPFHARRKGIAFLLLGPRRGRDSVLNFFALLEHIPIRTTRDESPFNISTAAHHIPHLFSIPDLASILRYTP